MGSDWSREETSQQNEELSKTPCIIEKVVEKTTSASSEIIPRRNGRRIGLKLPHNCEAIVKDADTPLDKLSMDELYDQLYAGVFLNQTRKKYWIENKSDKNCFMVFARDLSITWADDDRYWNWTSVMDKSGMMVDMAELSNVCWLEVHGKFDTSKLSPRTMYQVSFEVMIKDPAYGWDVPVNLRITLPNGNKVEHKENLMEKTRGKWIEIPVGEFRTMPENVGGGEIEISLYEYGSKWKRGLVIKGVIIRPKT